MRVLIDERKGRHIAQSLNLRVTGTAGVLLLAKEAGLIRLVRPVLDALVGEHGLHIADALRSVILRDAGEA